MKICRLCLYKGEDNQVLSIWENEIDDLATKIRNCVSVIITKEDNLPTSACLSCIHQVTQWEIFRNTCQKSNEILLKSTFAELQQNSDTTIVKVENSLSTSTDYESSSINTKEEQEIEDIDKETLKEETISSDEWDEVEKYEETDYFESDSVDYALKTELYRYIYKCEICLTEFDNCFEFIEHQEVHDGQPVFQCDKCPELFNTRKNLVEHDNHHQVPCLQCGKMILRSSMKLHVIKHTDKFKCTQCNGRFTSRTILTQHITTVHMNARDYICKICGKGFPTPTAVNVHLKSHSDERLYPCKLCSYAGRTASAIYVHMSTHANNLCVCKICSKVYKSNRNLYDHLRRVHNKVKKYDCTFCGKKFVDKYMLNTHIRCHTGVRPYKCTLCRKAFIRSDGLKEHMTTHEHTILYNCEECGKEFTSKRSITRHICFSAV